MNELIHNLSLYGYLILAFYSFGGGMLGLIGAGVLSSLGKMDITISIFVATTSNFLGDNFLFFMTQINKKDVLKYLRKHRRKIAYTNLLMKKYGDWVVFLQKYIYGVKTLVPIVMGLSRYDFKKFTVLNLLASIVWGIVIGLGSYYFSSTAQRWFS